MPSDRYGPCAGASRARRADMLRPWLPMASVCLAFGMLAGCAGGRPPTAPTPTTQPAAAANSHKAEPKPDLSPRVAPGSRILRDVSYVADARPAPRFLFASAERGNPGSREISERMVGLIQQAGGRAEHLLLKGKTHSTANHEVGMSADETGALLLRFVLDATAAR